MKHRRKKNTNKYYAVIASKRRRGQRYAMALSSREMGHLIDSRCPVYIQKPAGSAHTAERILTELLSAAGEKARRIEYDLFSLLQETDEQDGSDGYTVLPSGEEERKTHRPCFYDSEFGMYNYGDQQGDVVLIGAFVPGEGSCFRELIKNEEKAQLAERFQNFTGISRAELSAAKPFPEVFASFVRFVMEHKVDVIYCLGGNDAERLRYMLEKYGIDDAESRRVLLRFRNFQKWLSGYDSRIASFSLESLASLCGIVNQRPHDAFSDAETLAGVWEYLSEHRIGGKEIAAEQEATQQRNRYRKSRKISFERMPVSDEILSCRDRLIAAMQEENQKGKYVSSNILRALCDDLSTLLVEQQHGCSEKHEHGA
ncbi:MAG: exonuclease domain-containing protein [Eubacteriales bacterium]|nr:exonuclease domain-containing protein [Eubacteriales bacterium]